jgi:uncharacterized protein
MKIFDPHIHMSSRTTDDFEAMVEAGIAAVLEPSFWWGQPRTSIGTYEDYFLWLLGWEKFRANQFGLHYFCTLGINPKEANNEALTAQVLDVLPRYLEKDGVVGVGEIGYDDQTDAEDKAFVRQLELAGKHDLPVLIHTPHRDKRQGNRRIIERVKDVGFPVERTLVDHNTEETLAETLESGCWAGHSVYPHTKMTEERMAALVEEYGPERIIVNSAADWGVSDPLKVAKTAKVMLETGMDPKIVEQVVWKNPLEFFGQSGRMNLAELEKRPVIDQTQLFQGSSVLRGQTPKVEK